MNLQHEALPAGWEVAALLAMLPVWVLCARVLGSKRFASSSEQAHLFWGSCLALVVLWSLKATLGEHLTLHLLGIALLTLVFGVSGAVMVATCALVALAALEAISWQTLPANALLMGALPAALAWLWLRAIERWLPRHFLVYIFAGAFAGGAVTMLATGATTGLALGLAGAERWRAVIDQYWATFAQLAYAEATLTGMLVTLLVVFRPEWLATFDGRSYFPEPRDRSGPRR